jgi:hypothetical protein
MTNGSHPKETDSKVASARKSEKKPIVVKENKDTEK